MGVAGRVRLLGAQAFALGLALAWTTIAATTAFLEAYGSRLLPVAYLASAVAGAGDKPSLMSQSQKTKGRTP